MSKSESSVPPTCYNVYGEVIRRGHEQLCVFNYPEVGLKAIVGIHSTVLGPALGGCRLRVYEDENQAIDDALRLSEGMTYKNSIAGLDLGGGKSVLVCDPKLSVGREEMFRKFAECLNHLNGRYITAEDMGTSVEDIMVMRSITRFAAGFSQEQGGSGDPSPWTALGVFKSIEAACERLYGSKSLQGRTVALEGVGHVGMYLCDLLKDAGAQLYVSDVNQESLNIAKQRFHAEVVSLEELPTLACDVYAPCAIGQTVNEKSIPKMQCKIIAGAANNQLSDERVYNLLNEKNILYCPDFVINSGGVISVGAEYNPGGWTETWVRQKVNAIYETIHRILDESEKRKAFPEVVALDLAKERIEAERAKRRA